MKFSIFLLSGCAPQFVRIPHPVTAYERVAEIAKLADDAGYETLFVPDHLTTISLSRETLFQTWSLIIGLALETSRVRLSQLVAAHTYRNPAPTAKFASSVDVISHGRLVFGVGAGWWEPDDVQYGYEFGTAVERLHKLVEAAGAMAGGFLPSEIACSNEGDSADTNVARQRDL